MQYTEQDLQKLVAAVEKEFTAHLAKAEGAVETLAKSEDGEKPKDKPEGEEGHEAKPEGESKPEQAAAPAEGAKPEGEAPAAQAAPAAPAEAGAPGQSPEGAGHDYDAEDLEHMHKMYMSMSEGELKAHHDCIAKIAKCGTGMSTAPASPMGKSEIKDENPKLNSKPTDKGDQLFNDKKNGGIEGSAPHNALGPKSPASDANGAKINKSEHDRRNGGKQEEQAPGKTPGAKSEASNANGDKMNKSEVAPELELLKSQLEAEKAEKDGLKKNLDAVSAFLTKLVEKRVAPAGKAITSLDVIAKSEGSNEDKSLTKGEIDSKLLSKSQDPKLEKSDRDLINAFYLNSGSINSISHLLK